MTKKRTAFVVSAGFAAGLVIAPSAAVGVTYFSATRTVSGLGSATCPSGWRATGGGVEITATDSVTSTSSRSYKVRTSRPNLAGTGWVGSMTVTVGSYSSISGWRYTIMGQSAKVYALCVK